MSKRKQSARSKPRASLRSIFLLLGGLILLVVSGVLLWLKAETQPTEAMAGAMPFIRWRHSVGLPAVLVELQRRRIVRNASAMRFLALLTGRRQTVGVGTYRLEAGMRAEELLSNLSHPIRQLVRIPETNWANRTAHYLEAKQVLNAAEYMRLVRTPSEFQASVPFPLKGASLEGYLYPDTYDLPPLLGAKDVILRQLKTFQRRVWEKLSPTDLFRTLTIASMVQMETGSKSDSPRIAGVIENRLKKKMALQIDSTLLYGIQKWRRLTFADYRNIDSPYNTYTHRGLPPGPICSPSIDAINAVLHPEMSDYLYYVALPNGQSLFSSTYKQHLANIQKRKLALKMLGVQH